MSAVRGQRWQAVAAAASGLLLLAAYPPYGQAWVAWFALVPLLAAWQGRSPLVGPVAVGTLVGGLLWGAGVFHPVLAAEGAPWSERLLGFAVLTCGVAAFLLLFACLFRWWTVRLGAPQWRGLVVAPALWIAMEYVSRAVAAGFSPYFGVTQAQAPVVQVAPLAGIHGVGALLVAVNVALSTALVRRLSRSEAAGGRERKRASVDAHALRGWAALSAGVAIVALALVQGALALPDVITAGGAAAAVGAPASHGAAAEAEAEAPVAGEEAREILMVLVQPYITPAEYEAAASGGYPAHDALLREVLELTGTALAGVDRSGPRFDRNGDGSGLESERGTATGGPAPVLVTWPETTLHVPALSDPAMRETILAFAQAQGASLLVGLPRPALEPALGADRNESAGPPGVQPGGYNSAFLIRADGVVAETYDKVHVIPIAEAQYARGREVRAVAPFDATPTAAGNPGGAAGHLIGIGICSDVVEPRHARRAVLAGAQSLHYLSSLAQVGHLSHLAVAFLTFRAVEHRLHATLTATTGPTVVVDPRGVEVASLAGAAPGALVVRVPARSGAPTPYTRYGDWPVGAAGLLLGAMGLAELARLAGRTGGEARRPRRRFQGAAPGAFVLGAMVAVAALTVIAPTVSADEQVVRFWAVDLDLDVRAVFEQGRGSVKAEFERAYPGVRLEVTWLAWDELYVRLLEAAAAGTLPHVVQVGAEAVPLLAEEGVLVPIDGRLADWRESEAFHPAARAAGVWGGRTYGLPLYAAPMAMVYSAVAMVRSGWDSRALPSDWGRFTEFVRRHTAVEGAEVVRRGTGREWLSSWRGFLAALWQAGGEIDPERGRADLVNAPALRALAFLSELHAVVYQPHWVERPAGREPPLASGAVASLFTTSVILDDIASAAPEWLPFLETGPPLRAQEQATPLLVDLVALTVAGAAEEHAWELLRRLTSEKVTAAYARATGYLAPYRQRSAAAGSTERERAWARLQAGFFDALERYARPVPAWRQGGSFVALVSEAAQAAVTGRAEAEAALREAAERWSLIAGARP